MLPASTPHRHAGNARPARNAGGLRRDKGMPAAHPPAETLLLKRENRPPSYSENKIREEAEQSGDPAATVDLRSSENIKLDRVRLRDDAPADAGARPGKPGGRAPPSTRWGASRCNPQGAGTPGPGSRPQPPAAAARRPAPAAEETERPQGGQAEETGASGTDHAPAAAARRRETSEEARWAGEG